MVITNNSTRAPINANTPEAPAISREIIDAGAGVITRSAGLTEVRPDVDLDTPVAGAS